jgi:hypothetical protein
MNQVKCASSLACLILRQQLSLRCLYYSPLDSFPDGLQAAMCKMRDLVFARENHTTVVGLSLCNELLRCLCTWGSALDAIVPAYRDHQASEFGLVVQRIDLGL